MNAPGDPGQGRVLGWDLLRGLCAMAVVVYHLLLWQDVAALHTFGSYGVYLFFVLSGASLTYTYSDRLQAGSFSFGQFLWVRYMRLAPLYLALTALVLPWKVLKEGATAALAGKVLLNASFLFGFHDPALNATLVGGWSLGIEAIFYLLFPVLAWLSLRAGAGLGVFGVLLAVQAAWIAGTVGAPGGYASNVIAYHQVPAFAAYFMGGCLLGQWRRSAVMPAWPASLVLAAIALGFVLLALLNPLQAGDELLGWRGAACCALCFVLAGLASTLRLGRGYAAAAAHLGDATYGLYLIHPVIFFGLTFALLPRLGLQGPATWSMPARLVLLVLVAALAFLLALASERLFERPLRDWSKRRSVRARGA